MNRHHVDRVVRRAQPPAGRAIEGLDLSGPLDELLEEIMSRQMPATGVGDAIGETADDALELPPTAAAPPRPRRRRLLVAMAAAAAFVVAVAGPAIVFRDDPAAVVPAGSPIRATPEGNPYLLLGEPGWTVSHVDEEASDYGEVQFENGPRRLAVHWYPTDQYQDFRDDRVEVSEPEELTVLGTEGLFVRYGPDEFDVVLPPAGRVFLEIRGNAADKAAFAQLLARLRQVSKAEWIAAMPDTVVTPESASRVAGEMLDGVPLPPGYDPAPPNIRAAKSYYQFGAAVVGPLACDWLRTYETALADRDEATMAEVAEALGGSRTWPVLVRMDDEGDYPEAVRQFADKVSAGQEISGYKSAFGCPGAETEVLAEPN